MKIPDLISPIIGHRVWRWDVAGLRSLNDGREVKALLRNRITVRMWRKDIAWNQRNLRWEAKALAP